MIDTRYGANPSDVKRYTTEELRREFHVGGLYKADEVRAVYSHIDRMVVFGVMPVNAPVPIDKGIDVWKSFGVSYVLDRREAGFFNLGGKGRVTVDGAAFDLGYKDCLYITKGAKTVVFESADNAAPAMFYGVSAPAHTAYETKLLTIKDAAKKPLGAAETANKRVINQFIHPDVLKTCQLSMGLTTLEPGSVWNTMPCHTHERRMEVYTYFEIPEGDSVIHLMGQPAELRPIVMNNYDAVISPSWSVHCGCGTAAYSFIWAMGGENLALDDMDAVKTTELR